MSDLFTPVTSLLIELPDGQQRRFRGREAWALNELILAGARGCTPIDNPAPRWSHYVFLLRRHLNVETVPESHKGPFAGSHARYVLRTPLRVVDTVRADAKPVRRAA